MEEEAAVADAAAAANSALPALGAGLAFRSQFRASVFLNRDRIGFLEITADHYLRAPREKLRELDLLASHFPLVPHALGLSLGSADGVDDAYLERLAGLIERVRCPWWSEHIAFTRAGGVPIGHLAPAPLTRQAVDAFCRNVERVRRRTGVPLILENITWDVVLPGAEMSEPEFLEEITRQTGCGLLLDVTNLYTNAVNHRFDPLKWLDRMPLDRVVEVHVAGGHWLDGYLIDSHSRRVAEEVWDLVDRVLARSPVKGVVVERDERLPGFDEVLADVERARAAGEKHGRWAAPAEEPAGASLAAIQAALARLYTDPRLRERFFAAPDLAALELGLGAEEAAYLRQLAPDQVRRFAATLERKKRRGASGSRSRSA